MNIIQIAHKVKSVNRKVEILSHSFNNYHPQDREALSLKDYACLSEEMEVEDVMKIYEEWKGALLVSHFIPKKKEVK